MIKIYTAMAMTGRYKDEILREANMLVRVCKEWGFEGLNPALRENIQSVHEHLNKIPDAILEQFWRDDKAMIRDADILLDYKTQNKSDGANQEIGYARWCLWKPVVRVWYGPGALISRLEDDVVVDTIGTAMHVISDRWGTYEKLLAWREKIMRRSYYKWHLYQRSMYARYANAVR
jgi:nucleoside 2-deoxyribosyltransferase